VEGDIPTVAPPPRDVLKLKGRNIYEWWPSADTPVAGPGALAEVQQAEMPYRLQTPDLQSK